MTVGHTFADLRRVRHAIGTHEAGHAAFLVGLGAAGHITDVEVIERREGNRRYVTGRCGHHLGFPDTPKGGIAGTALHLAGAWAARCLLPDPGHEL